MRSRLPAERGPSEARSRLLVDVRGVESQPWGAIRLFLVADVLRRIATDVEHARLDVTVVADAEAPRVHPLAERMGIVLPAAATRVPPAVGSASFDGFDRVVRIAEHQSDPGPACPARSIRVAPVELHDGRVLFLEQHDSQGDIDPFALRLALLRFHHDTTAVLSLARLHRASETLSLWRLKVSDWYDMDPAPAPAAEIAAMRNALMGRVDTGEVLIRLHRMETDIHLLSGSKFDAFAWADRVLGVGLTRLAGTRHR